LFLGSYTGLMKHIFKEYRTPLFERSDALFNLKPLQYDVCKDILVDLEISTFVEIYSIFGGVPKYYELLENVNDRTLLNIISEQFLDIGAPLLDEGTNILISEFKTQMRIFCFLHWMTCQNEGGKPSIPPPTAPQSPSRYRLII